MTTVKIELPDALVNQARAAGLLTADALHRLLIGALKQQAAAQSLLQIAQQLAAAELPPMSPTEIKAEIDAHRAARRH